MRWSLDSNCMYDCRLTDGKQTVAAVLESVTSARTFKTRQHIIDVGVSITVYVYKETVIIQLTGDQTGNRQRQTQTPRICLNISEFDWIVSRKGSCSEVFYRLGCKPLPNRGLRVFRRDVRDCIVDITSTGFRRLKIMRDIVIADYNAAKIHIDSLNAFSLTLLGDLLVGCGVYYDSSIRQSKCEGCRSGSNVDPFQNIHSCAFETDGHKRKRAEAALSMVDTSMVHSILASNGLQPLTYNPIDIDCLDRNMLIRRIAAYNVTYLANDMIRIHKHVNSYMGNKHYTQTYPWRVVLEGDTYKS